MDDVLAGDQPDARAPKAEAAPSEAVEVELRESFEAFYLRELKPTVRLAAAICPSSAVAEELAQDAFFDAYRRWSRIGRYDNPATWVRRAVLNRAVSTRRRLATERTWARTRRVERLAMDAADHADVALWDEVRRLPRRQVQVVALHYVEQLTTDEIASTLGISVPSVKTHLRRARSTLSQRLESRDA